MAFRHHKLKRPYFLISKHVHPQTMAVVETRASAIGVALKLFDGKRFICFEFWPSSASLVTDITDSTISYRVCANFHCHEIHWLTERLIDH